MKPMPVIAQLRGLFTQLRGSVIAWLTQSAGHVFPEPTTQRGSPTSAETTPPPHQLQPAPTQPSQKSGPVQQTTADQRHGSVSLIAQALAANPSILAGFRLEVPAPQTHQPVKQEQSQRKEAVQQTTQVSSSTRAKAAAQTPTASPSGEIGQLKAPAPQTPQPAKRKRKPSKPVASKTKPAAKRSRAKAPAQTPTAKKSGRTGK